MEIPNLSQPNSNFSTPNKLNKLNPYAIVFIIVLAATSGFWLSRFVPMNKNVSIITTLTDGKAIPAEDLNSKDEIQAGKIYGDQGKNFKDAAIGVVESGGLNGEGTHNLVREGGATQKAALTSSAIDLDLFVGKKVEVKGETHASTKVGWFMDVGNIKVLE